MSLPERTQFLVVGAGIAGLRAAVELAQAGEVLVVTKGELAESNTQYAQGGIAVAMSGDEDVALHLEDTVRAGDGLVDEEAARVLVEEGPARVEELLAWGTKFDRERGSEVGELLLTREGAHSLPRILHANGDATGREIGRALLQKAREDKRIRLVEWTSLAELMVEDGRVSGAALLTADGLERVAAAGVLLASGGAGQVYSDTTNPPVATGDGIATAFRAGAEVADMEFFQFHPTALSLPGVPRFLLSEALRGEGAVLRNAKMERFMPRYHALAELAPRDVVARAITREGIGPRGESLPVYLDMREVKMDLKARFPGISAFLEKHGLELGRDLIPVRPAAHYLMGGVRTDTHGRASLRRLYAAGEVACTGVHGANRLASNSLLEGLVFGARAGEAMRAESGSLSGKPRASFGDAFVARMGTGAGAQTAEIGSAVKTLRAAMWKDAGLLRDAEGLARARAVLEGLRPVLAADGVAKDAAESSARNLYTTAELIVRAAKAREESRGAHFRNDFPARDDAKFGAHSVIGGDALRWETRLSD
jgi:L-aspartate oxidase